MRLQIDQAYFMKYPLALCTTMLIVLSGYTQNLKVLDSLNLLYNSAKHDTTKIIILTQIASEYTSINPDTCLLIAENALELSEAIGFEKGKGRALRALGSAKFHTGNYSLALEYYQKGLSILQAVDDKYGVAKTLSNIGSIYDIQGNYPLALDYAQKSLKISNEISDKQGIASSLHDIGIIYRVQGNDHLALTYYQKSLAISEEILEKKGIARTLNLIGNIYRTQGENRLALDYYQKSLKIHQEMSNKQGIARGLHNLGHIFSNQNDFSKAIEHYEQSLNLRQEIGDKHAIPSSFNALAQVYYKQKEYDKAINYAASGLKIAQEIKALVEIKALTETLYQINKHKGDYLKALEYHELYKITTDSIFNTEKSTAIANLEAKVEIEQKEREIEVLNRNQQFLKREKQLQQYFLYLVLAGMSAVVFFAYAIYASRQKERKASKLVSQQKEEISQQKEALEIQTKELQVVNQSKDKLFAIIGHDLRSPIASLHGVLTLTSWGSISKEEFDTLSKKMLEGINNTIFTLNNLLNWANSQMKGMDPMPRFVSLRLLAQENVDFLQNIAIDKNITINNNISEEAKAWVDANQISLVFRNLISNALKFTSQGGNIELLATLQDGHWKVTISDTGVGITKNLKELIFKKHQSFTTYGTKGEKGTGLGLILCQEMIEKNNGQIGVESGIGKGSTFWFKLPCIQFDPSKNQSQSA